MKGDYNKVPWYIKLIDFYLRRPVLYDLVLVIVILLLINILQSYSLLFPFDCKIMKSLNSDLISTSISLAGFVLASLTIIVTFKDSVNSRFNIEQIANTKKNQKDNGRDLFFQSKHYFPTVKVFFSASLILLLLFFLLSVIKVSAELISPNIYALLIIGGLVIIVTTVLRSLYLLLQIIKLQNQDNKSNVEE